MRKNSKILVAIIFVGLALAGLISVQVYWVNYTFHLSEKEFTEKVKDALQKTAEEMNDQQIAYEMFTKVHINPNEGFYLLKNKWKNKVFANSADTIPMFYDDSLDADFRWNNLMFSQHVNVSMLFQFRYTS